MKAMVDCWHTIGVHGDASCPELERQVHCRNCPVYSSAGLALLDREPQDDYVASSTAHFAQPNPALQRDTQSAVIFRIRSEWLGLPPSVITEIARVRQIHSLPHRRGHVLGVVNVHGELVVCVSLGRVLGLDDSARSTRQVEVTAHARLLVMRRNDVRIVCQIDEVHGIHRFQTRQLQNVPGTIGESASTYTKHLLPWRDRSVGLLDEQRLFHSLKRGLA